MILSNLDLDTLRSLVVHTMPAVVRRPTDWGNAVAITCKMKRLQRCRATLFHKNGVVCLTESEEIVARYGAGMLDLNENC